MDQKAHQEDTHRKRGAQNHPPLGRKLKVPRKSHVKKDAKAAQEFRVDLENRLAKAAGSSPDKAVRI
jgi:hypothetical protein